jgi:hypothetical protein
VNPAAATPEDDVEAGGRGEDEASPSFSCVRASSAEMEASRWGLYLEEMRRRPAGMDLEET